MSDKELKQAIAAHLTTWGFDVVEVPEGAAEAPDLLVSAGDEQYLIEIKEKGDEPLRPAEEARLADGEIVVRSTPWGRRNTIDGIIKKGVRQLAAYAGAPGALRLLWLHAGGDDPALYWEQFHGTLYGTANIHEIQRAGSWLCYYFHDSAFYRWRHDLDGAILSADSEASLCINTYGAGVAALRQSLLCQRFGQGICDPEALESAGEAMLADCETDRRQTNVTIGYIQRKYERPMLDHLEFGMVSTRLEGKLPR